MTILGRLLANRRAGEAGLAWNDAALAGSETLSVSSSAFADGDAIPLEHAGRRVGGKNVSPALNWDELPADTRQLLLFVEDVDAPVSKPFVHCVALIAPDLAGDGLPAGALSREAPGVGVTLLRAQMGSGYRGPEPIKGHGPHRYIFELFALGTPLPASVDDAPVTRVRPRQVPALIAQGSMLARGRMTGTYQS